MNHRQMPEATHFVGVLVPEDLRRTLESCRGWMHAAYGCRSGHSTPIHITLIPPFQAMRGINDQYLVDLLSYALRPMAEEGKLPFDAHVKGFCSFGERTLFAALEKNALWTELRNNLQEEYIRNRVGDIRKDTKPLVPHLTVANRDIPKGAIVPSLSYFDTLDLDTIFPVSQIGVFHREGYRWVVTERNTIAF